MENLIEEGHSKDILVYAVWRSADLLCELWRLLLLLLLLLLLVHSVLICYGLGDRGLILA